MRFLFFITSQGRIKEVDRLLASLCRQKWQDMLLVIGDQSGGLLSPIWSKYEKKLHLQVIPLKKQGVCQAKNIMMRRFLTETDIVAFPDDDCWYAPDTLEKVAKWFTDHPQTDILLTSWRGGENAPVASRLPEHVSRIGAFRRAETYVQFYRYRAVQKIGLWDENFIISGDDTDYLLRGIEKGLQIHRSHEIEVYHPTCLPDSINISRWHTYGHTRMLVLHKHHFPLWFKVANIVYPLYRLLREPPRFWQYRWHMFLGRLEGILKYF